MKRIILPVILGVVSLSALVAQAQEQLPADNGLATYHTSPRYRETESHPLRILGYIFHPIGWVAREAVFRPISYLISSNDVSKSVFGYREPFDYRSPECFSADESIPDCRNVRPFNYGAPVVLADPEPFDELSAVEIPGKMVFFPDVNFDFDRAGLNDLGKGRAYQIADLLKNEPSLRIVLEGHTDFIGPEQYNESLGMNRAEAVKQELVALGVPSDRLSTVTFGKSQPVLSQETDWARAVNRRVQVHFESAQ